MIDLVKQAVELERKGESLDKLNPIWKEAKKIDHEMSVHFTGEFPGFLFAQAAPNETKKAFDYRKSIFKPISKPPTGRALGATKRVWNPRNFTLPDLGDYMMKEYPGYGSLMNYFVQMFHPKKFQWANGVQVVRPRVIPTKKDSEGNEVVDASKPAEPIGIIIPAENVIDFNEEYVLVKLENKALVKYPEGLRRTGRIFEYYTATNIIRYTETSQETLVKPVFDEEVLFNEAGHGLDYIPAIKLKGVPIKSVEGRMLYESYFAPALPMLECAVVDHSTLQMSKYAHAFPQKWELYDACKNTRCVDGKVRDMEDGKEVWQVCESCGGSGRASGPIDVYQIRLRNVDGDITPGIPTPPGGYITPDSAILEFARKEIDTQIEQAFMMLQIDISNSEVKGSETALGKQIDRDELFSFLQTIANELFESFQWTANTIGKMRDSSWADVEIKPPHDFQIRSQEDLIEEMSNSNIPNIVRKDTIDEFITKRFASDVTQQRINEIIQYVDGLYMVAPEDIRVHSADIKPEFKVLHLYILKYITEFMEENPDWINGDLKALQDQLIARAALDVKTETFSPIFDEPVE